MFVLCLDKQIPIAFNHQRSIDETNMNMRDDVSLLLQMLHGHGSKINSSNRWFDKTMQVLYIHARGYKTFTCSAGLNM